MSKNRKLASVQYVHDVTPKLREHTAGAEGKCRFLRMAI